MFTAQLHTEVFVCALSLSKRKKVSKSSISRWLKYYISEAYKSKIVISSSRIKALLLQSCVNFRGRKVTEKIRKAVTWSYSLQILQDGQPVITRCCLRLKSAPWCSIPVTIRKGLPFSASERKCIYSSLTPPFLPSSGHCYENPNVMILWTSLE